MVALKMDGTVFQSSYRIESKMADPTAVEAWAAFQLCK